MRHAALGRVMIVGLCISTILYHVYVVVRRRLHPEHAPIACVSVRANLASPSRSAGRPGCPLLCGQVETQAKHIAGLRRRDDPVVLPSVDDEHGALTHILAVEYKAVLCPSISSRSSFHRSSPLA